MTVLIVPSWYKAGSGAQLGSFFREQAMALQKKGINAIIADATLQDRTVPLQEQFQLNKIDDEGLLTYSYTTPSLGGWRLPWLGAQMCYQNLKKIYRKIVADGIKIDVIHAHSFFPAGVAAVRLGQTHNIPVVITEHSSGLVAKTATDSQIRYLTECAEKADAFICVGQALKRSVIEYTDTTKPVDVIPNMVDKMFSTNGKPQAEEFSLVTIGNLIERKRFDLVLQAFASAFAGEEKVSLKIIGDGELRKDLEEMAQELGILEQVVFTGRLPRAEVAAQLADSSAFVLASNFETFGVVYIEALACGLPVIGTRNGGADDIITDECGCLVDTNNSQQLAEAMRYVYEHRDQYDKDTLAANCQANFGEDVVCNRIIEVYQRIAK